MAAGMLSVPEVRANVNIVQPKHTHAACQTSENTPGRELPVWHFNRHGDNYNWRYPCICFLNIFYSSDTSSARVSKGT